jgi:signal transduction histidine kinase
VDSPHASVARRSRGLLAIVDHFVPEPLMRSSDLRMRARVLVGASFMLGLFGLVVVVVRALTLPLDLAFWVGVLDVVLVLPLAEVQRVTGSNRIAGGLLTAALTLTFPLMLYQVGLYPAPVVLLFPLVPLIATYFVGVTLGLVSTLMIASASLGLGLTLPVQLPPPYAPFLPTFIAVGTLSPIMCFLLAALHERNRERNETLLQETNAALAAARDLAESADRRKTEFLRHMSHELRTPLNAIVGYSELLREQAEEIAGAQVLEQDLDKVGAASKHLLALIDDLLDIAKIEAGGVSLALAPLDLGVLLAELRGTIAPLAERGDNRLVIAVEPAAAQLRSDHQRLQQVLINLVGNACKFTEHGSITIRAEAADERAEVCIEVIDSGVGMNPDQLGAIFEPFVQVDDSPARRRQGSGLGLAITKKLVELLGGAITVRSRPGQGSTFTVRLPREGPPG